MDTNIIEKLDRIEKLLLEQQTMQKQVLNFNETFFYLVYDLVQLILLLYFTGT